MIGYSSKTIWFLKLFSLGIGAVLLTICIIGIGLTSGQVGWQREDLLLKASSTDTIAADAQGYQEYSAGADSKRGECESIVWQSFQRVT